MTRLPPGRQVHLPGVVKSDDGLKHWLKEEGPGHLDRLGPGPLDCVDVSQNDLTDDGVNFLADFLLSRGQKTRRLKLFNNRLREPIGICRLLEDTRLGVGERDGLDELHLSHNVVTYKMLERILGAVTKSNYPPNPPLWLRVEQNVGLANDARHLREAPPSGLKICFEAERGRSGCSLKHCRHGADVHLVLEKRG